MELIRLQKVIAENSNYSRRKAEELISQGKVFVNGKKIIQLGTKVNPEDEIIVNGEVLYTHEKVYYLLNKPIKCISTRSDEKNRLTVIDLIDEQEKIYPIGRLDYYTSGLLLLTNDGVLANGLMHPRFRIPKTYRVKFQGEFNKENLYQLINGVDIGGYKTKKAIVKLIDYNKFKKEGKIEITIFEGKNAQVRRMFQAINTKVLTLKRIKYAFLDLEQERLSPGEYRQLKPKEIAKLYNLINK